MPEDTPTLLFIGRDTDAQKALPTLRQAWRPHKVLPVPQAYQGLAVLLQNERLNLVVVAVDHLSLAEMSFFSAASRYRPSVPALAFGKGDKLSNPRLDEATRHGASEVLSIEQLPQRLVQLASQTQPRQSVPSLSHVINEQIDRLAEPIDQPKTEGPQNFLAGRNVAKDRRRAPAGKKRTEKKRTTADVVTPEELRVLLGEDGQEPENDDS